MVTGYMTSSHIYCQNPNLTTTQPKPNLNLVGFDKIITLHTPHHHTVGHHAPLLSFLTAPLKQLLVLSALYGKLPAMFGDHFPMLILIQGSLV